MHLGTFGTDSGHLVHFRGESNFSILVGFWHLSRLRGVHPDSVTDPKTGAGSCRRGRLEHCLRSKRAFGHISLRIGPFGELSRQVEFFDFGRILASQPAEGGVAV